jgi:eukaryotic-like serine/threonine-protein kinase
MDSVYWQKLKDIFNSASELEGNERIDFLGKFCGQDKQLKEDVLSLLEANELPGKLDHPPDNLIKSIFNQKDTGDIHGTIIGPFKIVKLLGHGGMGSVYLAERADGQFKQKVALKLLRTGYNAENQTRRFLAERQILASLNHKNIAGLIDGGFTVDDQPWFAMEYVEGVPVDEYCNHNKLNINNRLKLFSEICSAIQHAHNKLIIHRDLKPSNILVTAAGEIKLLDFGIAKITNRNSIQDDILPLTRTGLLPLTPAYASPEQILGNSITTSSDIYQLGILLYELLTGFRPYEVSGKTPSQIEEIICEKQPPLPSTIVTQYNSLNSPPENSLCNTVHPGILQKHLRGDLDTIIMKALRKEPERRYQSSDQLAADIQFHLDGKPVTAHPDSKKYRTKKLIRRHKIGFASSIIILLLLTGYAATITWHSQQTRSALLQAQQETSKAEHVTALLMDMFEASDPGETLGATITARQLLEQGVQQARQLDEQPEIKARILDLTGRIYMNLGDYDMAQRLLEQSLELRRSIFPPLHSDIGESLHNMGVLLWENGHYNDAEVYLREALNLKKDIYDGLNDSRANTKMALAIVLKDLRNFEEAESLYQEAIRMNIEIHGENHESIAQGLNNFGNFLESIGEYQKAKDHYRESLELYTDLYGESHPDVAGRLNNLGAVHARLGDLNEALTYHENALRVRLSVFDENHPDIAESNYHLGGVHMDLGNLEIAEEYLNEALAIQRITLNPNHPNTSQTLNSLGILMQRKGNFEASAQYYRESLVMKTESLGENHSEVGIQMNNIGLVLVRQERYDEALYHLKESQRILLYNFEADHPLLTYPLLGKANVYNNTERAELAEPLIREALEIQISSVGEDHWMIGLINTQLGGSLARQGKFERAEPFLLLGYEILADQLGASHDRTIQALERIVELYDRAENEAAAEKYKSLLSEKSH